GETTWKKIEPKSSESAKSVFTTALLMKILFSIIAPLVVWLFVRWIRPEFWPNVAEKIAVSPLRVLGFGALAVVLIPIVSILLMITVIGIPLSFILLALYGVAFYVSKIIFSVFIGFWFQKRFNWSNARAFWLFLLGLIILSILGAIPIIGMIVGLVIAFFGMGSIVLSLLEGRS
ncbi:MAG: hypothetical protein RR548_10025, partial [Carnobacterium sp.]|uniref:hypothetical protein n=1 Tax=Carnobacterium sp. TaxID=48221 RepID=UPI002FC7B7A3